jgi:LCP family protein required for cell wall assembly
VTPIPPAAAPIIAPTHITTALLLGSDQRPGGRGNATDTIILVTVNREANSVNMLSIPRDTYVYIPGWRMDRVNTALIRGEVTGYPGGGIALLRETLLYNFGVTVDYYGRVDLQGFRQIIDTMGGVDVPVDCALTEWRMISPELDPNDENSWEQFTLGVGMHHMDGDLALWYARARGLSTTDFDRNRRQQQVLRALWAKSLSMDLVSNLPALWDQMGEVVETDMQLIDAVELVPTALEMDGSGVRGRSLSDVLSGWRTPDTGAAVQLPDLEKTPRIVEWLYLEPGIYAVTQESSRIAVVNGTVNEGWDVVAADRLAWEGLAAIPGGQTEQRDQERTQIIDYSGRVKGTSAAVLARVLSVPEQDIIVQPDPDREVDFRIVLGYNYDSCTYR